MSNLIVEANKSYEINDHLFRNEDQYALGKYDITMRWLQEQGPLEGRTLLNVGCGAGYFSKMAFLKGMIVTGIEPEYKTYELAKTDAQGTSIEVIHGDLDTLSDDRKFDFIVMHDVLEHIENDQEAVDKLSKYLALNGNLVLSVPALPILYGLHDENLGHFRRYTKSSLTKVISNQFQIQKIRYYGFMFIPLVWLLSVLLRKPYPVAKAGNGAMSRLMRFACQAEDFLPFPLGTSVILSGGHKEIERADH